MKGPPLSAQLAVLLGCCAVASLALGIAVMTLLPLPSGPIYKLTDVADALVGERIAVWIILCLALIMPAAWWFARRITRPVSKFAEATERLSRDPNAQPLPLSGARELKEAALAFNNMQVAIQRNFDDRTSMFAAISHDLRTPLSRLRFKFEARSPDRRAVLSDLAQMERMISSVLEFLRQESETERRQAVHLRSLLQTVTDEAAHGGGRATLSDGEPLYVHGDVSALIRLFTNLVENAVRYGQRATVVVRRNDAMAEIEVQDAGPGLPAEELEAVFRPFYRSDAARKLDKDNEQCGVGLGLSISRTIARAHGGDVVLRQGPAGLIALVSLPMLETPPSIQTAAQTEAATAAAASTR